MSSNLHPDAIQTIYQGFDAPIAVFDCGRKCSPYNERGVPFCCDTSHTVPAAYQAEWSYLQENTDLWHPWEGSDRALTSHLRGAAPAGMLLVECLGHQLCQRNYRSLTCRSFPFFPYIDSRGAFIGLSHYWEYEDRCWVINNLDVVTIEYRRQFISAYEDVFEKVPDELKNFGYHSQVVRRVFSERGRPIALFHRDGGFYHINPDQEQLQIAAVGKLPKFGPYEIAAMMPFPDEQ